MKAKTPVHPQRQHHYDKGNNASLTMSNKGNGASWTTAEMPVHQQKQQCHCDESNYCHRDNGKDTCASTATLPHDKGDDVSLTTSNKGTCAHMQTNISNVCVCRHPCKHIICLISQASLQTLQTFAVG
jgi:hypothetical protein